MGGLNFTEKYEKAIFINKSQISGLRYGFVFYWVLIIKIIDNLRGVLGSLNTNG